MLGRGDNPSYNIYNPYKWLKKDGFHWGDFTLLIGVIYNQLQLVFGWPTLYRGPVTSVSPVSVTQDLGRWGASGKSASYGFLRPWWVFWSWKIWSNSRATSHDLGPQKVAEQGKSPYFEGNLAWWNIIIWPERWTMEIPGRSWTACLDPIVGKDRPSTTIFEGRAVELQVRIHKWRRTPPKF